MIWIGLRRITDCKNQKQLFPYLVVPIDQEKVRITYIYVVSLVMLCVFKIKISI